MPQGDGRIQLRAGPLRQHDARRAFLTAIETIVPEVLESLRRDVFPRYREAQQESISDRAFWRRVAMASANRDAYLLPLKQALADWMHRWHLEAAWVEQVARETLEAWTRPGTEDVAWILTRGNETYHIESVGYKAQGPARAKDFYEGFFRAVSRLNDGATHCVLALSHRAETGLPARAKQHRGAWLRIADALPELGIWLVDTKARAYKRTTWREWAEFG